MNANELISMIETAGYATIEYTAPGDYKTCVAVKVDDAEQFKTDVKAAGAAKYVKGCKVDSMGKRKVVYFPSVLVEVEE